MGRKTTKFTHFKRKKASHTTSVPKVTTGNSASSVPDNTVLELWNGYKASLYDKYKWNEVYDPTSDKLTLFCLRPGVDSVEVFKSIEVGKDLKYTVFLAGSRVNTASLFKNIPPIVADLAHLNRLLELVHSSSPCVGNSDERFHPLIQSRSGKFLNRSGETVAAEDFKVTQKSTIRHVQCDLLVTGRRYSRCEKCSNYRTTLRSLLSHVKHSTGDSRTAETSHVNFRFLSKSQKLQRMRKIKRRYVNTKKRLQYLRAKIKSDISKNGLSLDEETHGDIRSMMEEASESVGKSTNVFQKIFWEQQIKAAGLSDRRQMKWHPLIIKWALYLKHQSSKCYETLRESKCIVLPSQRTLRDYTHYLRSDCGFSHELDEELMRRAKVDSLENYQKCVQIAIDEMHVREGLVFDKNTGALVGFVDLGNVNELLTKFEQSLMSTSSPTTVTARSLAKSILVFFVCGLFTKLRFPYGQFPSLNLSGDLIFAPFWECVKRIEMCGLKVVAAVADGAKCNRAFFKMHGCKADSYKTLNLFAPEDRFIYFFSDPPHLVKTARNCLANSKRKMWCRGKEISWSHIVHLYLSNSGTGLSIIPKIKYEHIYLTSFSKMRVDLAAQILSSTVAKALLHSKNEHVVETATFCNMMNSFFDCFNVTNMLSGVHKRNPCIHPWRPDDFRIKDTFLEYLKQWEASVAEREGFSAAEKAKMLLSRETLQGLKFTVKSLIELQAHLFSLPGVKFFLTSRVNQDPLEKFFGLQRQRGGVNENPNVKEFLDNTQALRVINSVCGDVRGNVRGGEKRRLCDADLEPLKKRRRRNSQQQ